MNPLPVLVLAALLLFPQTNGLSNRDFDVVNTCIRNPATVPIVSSNLLLPPCIDNYESSLHSLYSCSRGGTTDYPFTGLDREFDVFLNFRGPDSRPDVVDIIYKRLTRAGFRVFLDNEEIRKGEVIAGELLSAITNSRIYITIFSKDYASSKWCLRELAKIIEYWEASRNNTERWILPIFNRVDVSNDLKLRSEVYKKALQEHKDKLGEDVVKPWADALRKVATISGWNLEDHGLDTLADLIIEEVLTKLTTNEDEDEDGLVGIAEPVEEIINLLDEGYRFVVIYGMGGIGKTTLAQAVFKKIYSRYQGSSFLRDIRRSSSDQDMLKLQEKLLLDALHLKSIKVSDIDDGIDKIRKRFRHQNVLIVLDDVDKRDHLKKLAANSSWFGSKSRIIITTRNIGFLPIKSNNEYFFYEMKQMQYRHALKLFRQHALPSPELDDISTQIVATTGGLPLALEAIGSFLFEKGIETWKYILEKLKVAPYKDVQKILMISYEDLEFEQQQIFLDIACFFNGEKMTDPIYFWNARKYYPNSGIEILKQRSMIKDYGRDTFLMHDQWRDLGRAISQGKVMKLENQWPLKPSRLWDPEVALDMVQKQEVDESILALNLGALDADAHFAREQFARGVNLKFLQLEGGNFEGDFKNIFQQLMWLSWSNCPLRFESSNLSFKSLVVLKLSGCEITEDWAGWRAFMGAKNLKIIHLECCKFRKKTPDFSSFLGLERLIIRNCLWLEEIDNSIGKLKHLNYLEISNGLALPIGDYVPKMPAWPQLLPDSIGGLKSLIELKIENAGLTKLPPSIGELVKLKLLLLRCPQLAILPTSIGKLILLEELDLSYSRIKELPNSIKNLKQLKILRMEYSAIKYLPVTIGGLKSLETLNLRRTRITHLPKAIRKFKRLKDISVSWNFIEKLPKYLVELENCNCKPCIFEKMTNYATFRTPSHLRTPKLEENIIGEAPSTVIPLFHHPVPILEGNCAPQELLNLPNKTNLVDEFCSNRVSLWSSIPCVHYLKMKLDMGFQLVAVKLDFSNLTAPPNEWSCLSNIQSLEIAYFDLQSLTYLPSSLEGLHVHDVLLPIDLQLLLSLSTLSRLRLMPPKAPCMAR